MYAVEGHWRTYKNGKRVFVRPHLRKDRTFSGEHFTEQEKINMWETRQNDDTELPIGRPGSKWVYGLDMLQKDWAVKYSQDMNKANRDENIRDRYVFTARKNPPNSSSPYSVWYKHYLE